ncbi:hypothetical protein D3C76_1428190 [compost metagenome]
MRRHGVLAAQAVLQQDQFGAGRKSGRELCHGLLRVVGLAGDQQAMDGFLAVGCFGRHRKTQRFTVFDQRQTASRLIGLQSRGIAHD